MVRQAYLLGGNLAGRLRDQTDRVLRAVLRSPDFSPNLASWMDTATLSSDGRMLAASSRAGQKKSKVLLWELDNHGAPPTTLQVPR